MGRRYLEVDPVTIDVEKVKALGEYNVERTGRQAADSPGEGCALEPPGHPSYYCYSVYTAIGDAPRSGPTTVFRWEGKWYGKEFDDYNVARELYATFYKPLPIDHERVRLWIPSLYRHFNHAYRDPEQAAKGKWETVFWPITWTEKGMLIAPSRHSIASQPSKLVEFAQVQRHNEAFRAARKAICTPENHAAVVMIRRVYPDYQPDMAWIEKAPGGPTELWWETLPERPSEEDCAESQRWHNKHPFNAGHCQWCGRTYPKT